MINEYNTLELARTYERQGYFQEAMDIYQCLDTMAVGTDPDIHAALRRMEMALKDKKATDKKATDKKATDKKATDKKATEPVEIRMAEKLEEWIRLLVLKKRLSLFQRIQARL